MADVLFPQDQPIGEAIEQYRALAVRTEAKVIVGTGGGIAVMQIENNYRLMHAAIGLAGEMLELQEAMNKFLSLIHI